ncbi:2-amino-4-hydroxy-6-hydroxymethyldihydropteridine diphosphokinase [Roseiarcus fermentans]|uniref:2-amino-4-hydroxy-6-hydroxymethyldihydropteridine pyrophosphokinase n=1 Tax=Roseiarcus fermentans TaxID=1473586 RepID=A0A366FHJ1_9HYPH|nr:2-amino-4-hydroxy-6-hydroxymethyldihydropteridine diphosphokinase [Roseiarcus fermentans]RBP14077.1 2-amino-4-hydroxy-6-hydroxymethyldihydropteridine diphosphokinase [Roseiarcus fermentans]
MPSKPPDPVEVALGLGGNVGDPVGSIRAAIDALGSRDVVAIAAVSSLWRTAPWGGVPQPDYANACAIGTTRLAPLALLDAVKAIERDLGRVDTVRWGPRVIDIDILFYGDAAHADERLVLPHRELMRRAFVLVPLAEIAPDRTVAGVRIADAARAIGREGVRPWEEG